MKKLLLLYILILLFPILILSFFFVNPKIQFFSFLKRDPIIRVKREAKGIIQEVPLEDYVLGVLSGEMPISFEKEALKAQAVAARSYALRKKEASKNATYDVVDTVMNQVYLDIEDLKNKWQENYEVNYQKLKEVVLETKGEYLDYQGEIANAMFFSTSSGVTENSEEVFVSALPYLRSVDSKWDSISPVFQENYEYSLSDFYTKLNLPIQNNLSYEVLKKTSTGRVKEIRILDKTFTGSEVASLLKLRSSFFTLEQVGSNVKIQTKGFGHGVGMSQYGAQGMAKEGYHYDDILKHYYLNTTIKKI